ncbi:MAG: glycosyltransferase family 2 protein, partial [bacterium]
CLVDRGWVDELVREFEADKDIAMVFGRTKKYTSGHFALSVKDKESREHFTYPARPWLIGHGNNMAMRRSVAEHVGHFDTLMGAGTRIGSGSDTEYIFRVLRSGRTILYSPFPVVYHDHDRTSLSDLRRVQFAYARGRGAFYCKYLLRGDAWIGRIFASEVIGVAVRLLAHPRTRVDALLILKGLLLGSTYRLFHEAQNLLSWRKSVKGVRDDSQMRPT